MKALVLVLTLLGVTAHAATNAPYAHGWFALPGGYDVTYVETTSRFFLRHDTERVPYLVFADVDPGKGGRIRKLLDVVVEGETVRLHVDVDWFYDDHSPRVTLTLPLARLVARFHEGQGSLEGFAAAIAADPSLAHPYVGLAREQLAHGDRDAAVATLVAGLRRALADVYLDALHVPALVPLLDAPEITAITGTHDGTARARDLGIAYSARHELAFEARVEDGESDETYVELVAGPLLFPNVEGWHPGVLWDEKERTVVDRFLHDLGFAAPRRLAKRATCPSYTATTASYRQCWARKLAPLGVPGLTVPEATEQGVVISIAGKRVIPDFASDDPGSESLSYFPDARVLVREVMPRGPCTVGGAPGAVEYFERYDVR